MARSSTLLSCLMLFGAAWPAAAQQTAPLITEPAPPVEIAPAQTQPYIAQPAAPAPPPSASLALRETHGRWEVRCAAQGDCVMTQIHRRTTETADAVFTVVRPQGLTDPDGNAVVAFAEIVVPLGVYLPGGLGLKIDQQPARAAPFERCIEEGCVVRAPISAPVLEQMKGGSTAVLVIFGAPDRPVQIPISLSGFTAAYNAIGAPG